MPIALKRRTLYTASSLPDNHTDDETFLSGLQKNIEFREVSLYEATRGATFLTQELCTVVIFILIYIYLYNEWFDAETLFICTSSLAVLGYLHYKTYYSHDKRCRNDIRTALIFIVFGYQFSPVLYTLTDTISTNTIYTMTFLMLLIHIIFFNYGVSAAIVSNSLSLNSAVFASVCLASRLSSAYHAFVFMCIAAECFVLFPIFRNGIKNSIPLTVILVGISFIALVSLSAITTTLFVFVVFFINVICPFVFVHYQKYKDNIYGPWDEAVVSEQKMM